jgi:small-conductance mechanosensitive channel
MNSSFIFSFFSPERIFFIGVGCIALVISWITGKILQKDILKKHRPEEHGSFIIPLAALLVKYLFLAIGVLALTSALGLNVSSIIQTIGLLGFGISFILKDLLADVVSGFFLLGYKPFTQGDDLTLQLDKGFYKGKVVSIDIRYTTLENKDEKILIPNSFLFKQPLSITK